MKLPYLWLAVLLLLLVPGLLPAQTATLHEVGEVGANSKRLNMVFLSEGFTQTELDSGKFADHVDGVVAYLFAQEPWGRYRSYFNIYRIEIASNQSGTDNPHATPPYTRDTYFGTGFHATIDRLLVIPGPGTSRAYSLLNNHVPEYDIPIMIVNDETYGGSGGPISVASLDAFGAELVEHEVGHSFAALADEYDYDTPGYPDGEFANATAKTVRSQIRWNVWIEESTPLFTPEDSLEYEDKVGHFEGAHYRATGYFRPHDNALMRTLGQPPGAVTREAFVLNYYDLISPAEGHSPATLKQTVTQREILSFSVEVKSPSTGPGLTVQWLQNGNLTPIATGPELNLPSQNLGDGKHQITAVITDPTDWVRRDPGSLLSERITWNLTLSNQGEPPAINEAPESQVVLAGEPATFSVDASPTGPGDLQYQWYKNGKAIPRATATAYTLPAARLADGAVYSVRVSGNGAFAQPEADLVVVDPQIQTLVLAQGKRATLAAPTGGPVQAYEWLRDEVEIQPDDAGYSGLGTAKLLISPLAVSSHRGLYSLRITTAAGVQTFDTHEVDIFDQPPQLILAAGASLPAGQVGALYGGEDGVPVEIAPIIGRPASVYGASGLPPGLQVDKKTGVIHGIPTSYKRDKTGQAIPFDVTLSASNGKGTSKVKVKLLIEPLPSGTVGSFVAVLPPADFNDGLGGRVDMVASANGSYSGKIMIGSQAYSFKGWLTSVSESSVVSGSVEIPRKGKPAPAPLLLDFTLTGPGQLWAGEISAEEESLAFAGWGNPWSKSAPADTFDGYHTFRLDVDSPPPGAPAGRGFGTFTIGLDGKTNISGRTADGEAFTSACHLGPEGELMIFSLQKGQPKGSLAGDFQINRLGDEEDANNVIVGNPETLSWWKPQSTNAKARVYADGLGPLALEIVGGRYQEPVSPKVALDVDAGIANAALNFTGASIAGVSQPPDTTVDILAKNKAQPSAPLAAKTTLKINGKLGTFTGKFSLLDANPRGIAPLQVPRPVTYQGIIVKEEGSLRGDGYFLLPDLPSEAGQDTSRTSPIQSGAVGLIKED